MKSNNRDIIQIGRILFDRDGQILYKDAQEIKAELKVLEVLHYLHQNNDRYVPLSELHDHVWEGKIVSDAAVRRVISKLRMLLEEEPNTPQFLKNQPKRGYRLFSNAYDGELPTTVGQPDVHAASSPTLNHGKTSTNDSAKVANDSTSSTPEDALNNALSDTLHTSGSEKNDTENTSNTPVANTFASPISTVAPIVDTSGGAAIALDSSPNLSIPSSKLWVAIGTAVIIICAIIASQINFSTAHFVEENALQPIKTMESDKRDIAVSSDGKLLAYSALIEGQFGYQLFLQDLDTGVTKQLTKGTYSVYSLAFINNDQHIAFVNFVDGNSSIQTIDLTPEKTPEPTIIIENELAIGGLSLSPNNNEVLAPIMENRDVGFIYKIDLTTGEKSKLTSSHQTQVYDYKIDMSYDEKHYAMLRGFGSDSEYHLRIADTTTGDVINTIRLTNTIFDMEWVSEEEVIILDTKHLLKVNVKTSEITELLENTNAKYFNFSTLADDRILLQENATGSKFMIVADINDITTRLETIPVNRHTKTMHYGANKNEMFVIGRSGQEHTLGIINVHTKEINTIYTHKDSISFLDFHNDGKQILIKVGTKIALLELASNKVSFIHPTTEFIEDARYSHDFSSVLYGERSVGDWHIKEYNLQTEQSRTLISGFRAIRQFAQGYFLSDSEGNVFKADFSLSEINAYPVKISYEFIYDWKVKGNYLVWTQTDLNTTSLNIHNITSLATEHYQYDYDKLLPLFSLSSQGNQVLYRTKSIDISNIYEAKLSAL